MKKTTFILCLVAVATTIGIREHKPTQPPPAPDVRPVSAVTEVCGDNIPPTAEIDFEPENPQDIKAISDLSDSRRDKPTLEQLPPENQVKLKGINAEKEEVEVLPADTPAPNQTTDNTSLKEPKMGDTRMMDGQKQVYFLGFGWIDDYGKPNVGIIADGDGNINKMVGTMD